MPVFEKRNDQAQRVGATQEGESVLLRAWDGTGAISSTIAKATPVGLKESVIVMALFRWEAASHRLAFMYKQ